MTINGCLLSSTAIVVFKQKQEAQLMLTTGSTRLLAVSRARDGVP